MNLFRHELLTLLRRWRGLILLWWLVVVINLGYACAWWWEGPQEEAGTGVDLDILHYFATTLSYGLLFLGIAVPALVLFAPLSPNRVGSAERLLPVSISTRIAVRVATLVLAVGIPWWLHEAVFLLFEVNASIVLTITAVAARILLTLAVWFGLGSISWATGSVWRAALAIGIGFLSLILFQFLDDSFPALRIWERIDTPPLAEHLPPQRDYAILSCVAAFVGIGLIALLVTARASNRILFVTTPIVATYIALFLSSLATQFTHKIVLSKASHDLASSFDISREETTSRFSFQPGTPESIVWNIEPEWKNLTPEQVPWISGTGTVTSQDVPALSMGFDTRHVLSEFLHYGWKTRELKRGLEAFPNYTIFGGQGHSGSITLTHSLTENAALSIPDTATLQAEAKLNISLARIHLPSFLPLDGTQAAFGTLGVTHVERRKAPESGGLEFHLQFYDINGLPGSHVFPRTRKLFGLINQKTQELVLAGNNQNADLIRNHVTACPLMEWKIDFEGSKLPAMARESSWLENAQLVLFEVAYEGQLTRTLSQSNQNTWSHDRHCTDYTADWASPTPPEPIALTDPQATEEAVRLAVYRLSRQPPAYEAQPLHAHESHRKLLRELSMEYPLATHWFRDFWNEEDEDFFLTELQKEPRNERLHHWHIERVAANRGWFHESPEKLKQIVAQRKKLSSTTLAIAAELGIENSGEALYRVQLVDDTETANPNLYPKIWKEVLLQNREDWAENRWKVRLARQLPRSGFQLAKMGEEEPLREMLRWYLRWEPSVNYEIAGRAGILFDDPWLAFTRRFASTDIAKVSEKQERLAIARKWLDSTWEYDPETMTFHTQP